MQRDLPASLTVIATYLGTKGSRLMQEFVPNTYPIGASNPCAGCPSGFVYLVSDGRSLKNAGQLQVRRRLRNGLTAVAQYTLVEGDRRRCGVHDRGSQRRRSSRRTGSISMPNEASSSFDQRHLLTAQVEYCGPRIAAGLDVHEPAYCGQRIAADAGLSHVARRHGSHGHNPRAAIPGCPSTMRRPGST